MAEYNYKLESFEGPLDLLLHLIEKHKVDIYDIPIVAITTQYLEYIDTWNRFDIHYSSEFLVMAATLLQIKSRMLLPAKNTVDEDESDPRDDLVQKLVEFKTIKTLAEFFSEQIDSNKVCFPRPEELSVWGTKAVYQLEQIPFYDLFYDALHRIEEKPQEEKPILVSKEIYSVAEAKDELVSLLLEHKRVKFLEYISGFTMKSKLVTAFLAILELLKLQRIEIFIDNAIHNTFTQTDYIITTSPLWKEESDD